MNRAILRSVEKRLSKISYSDLVRRVPLVSTASIVLFSCTNRLQSCDFSTSMPFYAVHKGREPGVYTTWDECKEQITGFSGARYKKYDTIEEAELFRITGKKAKEPEADKPTSSAAEEKGRSADDTSAKDKPKASRKRKQQDEVETDESVKEKEAKTDESAKDDGPWVDVYTDGCCLFNGRKGARGGVGVYWGADDADNLAEALEGRQSNNRAEITAAVRAIEQAKKKGIERLCVNTDSDFMINSMTNWMESWKKKDWKTSAGQPVKNKEDFLLLDEACQGIQIKWKWVKGHSGILGNEEADRLANLGAAKK